MSIPKHMIGEALKDGALFELPPGLGQSQERRMLISPEMKGLLFGPWVSKEGAVRLNRLRADIEAFVAGDIVTVNFNPSGKRRVQSAYLARLDPPNDEVWDIRSRDPSPGLRVIGRFARTDIFVALTCWPRSQSVNFLNRPPLNDADSKEWNTAVKECRNEWRKLFLTYEPVHGEEIEQYISRQYRAV